MRLIPLGVDINHFYPNPDAGLQIRRFLAWEEQGTTRNRLLRAIGSGKRFGFTHAGSG